MVKTLGFLGVGTIAAAMVRGLQRVRPEDKILLSPRSTSVVARLVDEHPNVRSAASNEAVVEESRFLFLTMRPPQLRAAVAGLQFRSDQIVVSCVANTALQDIAALVAPATPCRLIPLPGIERGAGPIVLYPPMSAISMLFAGSGELIEALTEAEFSGYGAGSATMSTFFAVQAAIIRWLIAHRASAGGAESYVRSMQLALAQTAMKSSSKMDALITEHETIGGINERVRSTLDHQGWFDAIGLALDGIGAVDGTQLTPVWRVGAEDRPTYSGS